MVKVRNKHISPENPPRIIVTLDKELIPRTRRTHVGREYLFIGGQPGKVKLDWDFEHHPKFLQFLGYWFDKGYYWHNTVSVSAGKHLSGLMPVFDYVATLFSCHYRIMPNRVVHFDSVLLKDVMLGLEFADCKRKDRPWPSWLDSLSWIKKHFLSGYLTGCTKVTKDKLVVKCPQVTALALTLSQFHVDIKWASPKLTILHIPADSTPNFKTFIGFRSDYLNEKLNSLVFVERL